MAENCILSIVIPTRNRLKYLRGCLRAIARTDLADAEPFAAVAQKIYSFIGDLPIVAHNAMFDSKFLKQTFAKVGVSFDDHPVWDSLTVSRIAYQNVPNHRLDTLVQELGIERSRAHRALPDAEACGHLFVMALDKIANADPWLVDALAKIARGSDWSLVWKESEGASELPQFNLPDVPLEDAPAKERAPRVGEFFKEGGLLSTKVENFQVRHCRLQGRVGRACGDKHRDPGTSGTALE